MRTLTIFLLLCGGLVWFSSSPVYYFVWGADAAKLPQHTRMTAGDTEAGCESLVRDFNRLVSNTGVYCERVPRWKHWSNSVQNISDQIGPYRFQRSALVE
jgi:hypothetical protein